MTLIYRTCQLSDIEELIELRILMQSEVNQLSEISEEKLIKYKQKCHDYFYEFINNKKYLSIVALYENKIVGTAGVCFYHKPPSLLGDSSGIIGYVTNVYTREPFRKKGIGSQMMAELKQLAEKIGADKLHLGATIDGANIYRSVGFEEPRFLSLECKTSSSSNN